MKGWLGIRLLLPVGRHETIGLGVRARGLFFYLLCFLPTMIFAGSATSSKTLKHFEERVMKAARENNLKDAGGFFLPEIRHDEQFKKDLPSLWEGLQRALLRRDFEPYLRSQTREAIKPGSKLFLGKKKKFIVEFDAPGDGGGAILWASEKDFQRYLFLLVTIERKQQWYLQFAYAGLWKVAGLDAEGWFARAEQMRHRGHLVPAALAAQVGGSILRPAPVLGYRKQDVLEKIAADIEKEEKKTLHLPLNLLEAPGYPQIIHLEPDFDSGNLVPIVHYVSRIALADTKQQKASAKSIVHALDVALPGMASEFKRIILRAYNEPPTDPQREYSYLNIPVEAH